MIEEEFDVRPDLISEHYIVECKTGTEGAWAREYVTNQIRDYIDLASPNNENKTLVYLFWECPSPNNWWRELMEKLKANGVSLRSTSNTYVPYLDNMAIREEFKLPRINYHNIYGSGQLYPWNSLQWFLRLNKHI